MSHTRGDRPSQPVNPNTLNATNVTGIRPGDTTSETNTPHTGDWDRSQWVHRLRSRRRNSRALDALVENAGLDNHELCDVIRLPEPEPNAADTGDYWRDSGMTLGWPERSIAGRKPAGLPLHYGIEAA